jgi:hypothetical protein
MADRDKKPIADKPDPWASRRRKNVAIFSAILALAALFFVITILRMS